MRQGHEWFKLIPGNKKRKRYAKKNKTKQNCQTDIKPNKREMNEKRKLLNLDGI